VFGSIRFHSSLGALDLLFFLSRSHMCSLSFQAKHFLPVMAQLGASLIAETDLSDEGKGRVC
jgi:hypothetical protein